MSAAKFPATTVYNLGEPNLISDALTIDVCDIQNSNIAPDRPHKTLAQQLILDIIFY